MTVIARFRGCDYQIIKDMFVMPELKPVFDLPEFTPARGVGPQDMTAPFYRKVTYYLRYIEYEVTMAGVTQIHVYLPEGVEPPRPGLEL